MRRSREPRRDLRYDLAERVPLVFVAGDVATDPAAAAGLIQRMPPGHYLIVPAETDDQIEPILLHELTHAFEYELVPTLSRVPLWFLEGLAEFERGRWMPSEPARAAVIVPLAQLTGDNREAARAVVSFIADEFGTDGIRRLLVGLRNASGDTVIEQTFGLGIDEFESGFEAYMRAY